MKFHKDGQKTRKPEKAVFTNMVMVFDDKNNVVVERRVKGWNGLVFPGGHLKEKETATELNISNLKLCGIKQWFHPDEGRNVCFLFKTNVYSGEIVSSSEGEIFWMPLDKLMESKEVASGFDVMLKVFLDESINEMFYPDDGDSEAKLL